MSGEERIPAAADMVASATGSGVTAAFTAFREMVKNPTAMAALIFATPEQRVAMVDDLESIVQKSIKQTIQGMAAVAVAESIATEAAKNV
ncbi:hypothetical protein ACIPY3_02480 [Paenarthrobacter sp. NPDC089714]|uniref:hypothetical protein n=1 Tax=Paenarthrobacter sp. NPDC089714 TaxID=3364377 RepID=UPI0037FA7EEF